MEPNRKRVEEISRAAVRIICDGEFLCSGVLIDTCIILTCAHALEDVSETLLFVDSGYAQREHAVSVSNIIFREQQLYDCAILTTATPLVDTVPLRISPKRPQMGAQAYYGGYRGSEPEQAAEIFPVSIGHFDISRNRWKLSAESALGFSGGPVATVENGAVYVVGVLTSNLRDRPSRAWMIETASIPFEQIFPNKLLGIGIRESAHICLRGTLLSDSGLQVDCVKWISEQLIDQHARILLLGHYGAGKTHSARQVAMRLKSHSGNDKLIQYIELKEYDSLPTWKDVQRDICNTANIDPTDLGWYLDSKKVLLILDGLDELTCEPTRDAIIKMIKKLSSEYPPGVSLLVTSRLTFFMEYSQAEESVADSRSRAQQVIFGAKAEGILQGIVLEEPTQDEVFEYIRKVSDTPDSEISLIRGTYNLGELSRRPVLLKMILECADNLKEARAAGKEISPGVIYDAFTDKWLQSEYRRTNISADKWRDLLSKIAVTMWVARRATLPSCDLTELVETWTCESNNVDKVILGLTRSTFLDLTDRGFRFSHKSFHEFFVARAIFSCLRSSEITRDPQLLISIFEEGRSLNELMDFLRDLLIFNWNQELLLTFTVALESNVSQVRGQLAHLLGHVASHGICQQEIAELLENCLSKESDPWARRTLSIANGRAGNLTKMNEYTSVDMTNAVHRKTNLSYHLEYYGSVSHTLLALVGHFSRGIDLLGEMDRITFCQIMDCEAPLQDGKILTAKRVIVQILGVDPHEVTWRELSNILEKTGYAIIVAEILRREEEINEIYRS